MSFTKKFTDEFRRDDVLTFRNKLMQEYEPKSAETMMMCVVTFFSKHLKIKLGMGSGSDWPGSATRTTLSLTVDEEIA